MSALTSIKRGVTFLILPSTDYDVIYERLLFSGAPTIFAHRKHVIKDTRTSFRLQCSFDGLPTPSITWLKDGEVLSPTIPK